MQIHDFYQKFASNEQCHLFQALRNLSQTDDLKATLGGAESVMGEWVEWPPAGGMHSSYTAVV